MLIVCRQLVLVLKERRAASADQFQRHVRLCRKTLEVFALLARTYGADASADAGAGVDEAATQSPSTSAAPKRRTISNACWHRVMSLLLEACTELLSAIPPVASTHTLSNALCAHLVHAHVGNHIKFHASIV